MFFERIALIRIIVLTITLLLLYRHQINTAKGILDTILSVQPKQGGSQGGETREGVVYHLADDMLKKLPKQYRDFEVSDRSRFTCAPRPKRTLPTTRFRVRR